MIKYLIYITFTFIAFSCKKDNLIGCWRTYQVENNGVIQSSFRPHVTCMDVSGSYETGRNIFKTKFSGYYCNDEEQKEVTCFSLVDKSIAVYSIIESSDSLLVLKMGDNITTLKKTEYLINDLGQHLSNIESTYWIVQYEKQFNY